MDNQLHLHTKEKSLPRVSVIIPCFNLGEFLEDAINSIQEQSFKSVEIIIVNDGSTDPETLRILANLDYRVCRVIHTTNQGPASARNTGIAECKGEYILPLDADDMISSDFIRKAVSILDDDHRIGIVNSKVRYFSEEERDWQQPEFSLGRLLIENMIVSTSMFRKNDWHAVSGYRDCMREGWEDWDFWISIVGISRKVYCLKDEYFYYRIRKGSRTRSLTLSVKVRLFITLILNHKTLYLLNLPKIFLCISGWIRDGRGRT